MRKRTLLFGLLLLTTPLLLPAGASAKGEITRLKVCGTSGCSIVTEMKATRAFLSAVVNGAPDRPAPNPRAFFTIRPDTTAQWPTAWPRYVYVPAVKMIRIQFPRAAPEWRWLGRRDPSVRRLTRGLRPYSAEA